jgi:ATPase subunit of ABC transporter with duplicated ATPase domains
MRNRRSWPNGSGKSTLCGLWQGLTRNGTARRGCGRGDGGYLQQEPELDPALNVMGNVMEGVGRQEGDPRSIQRPDADYNDENAEKAGKLQT